MPFDLSRWTRHYGPLDSRTKEEIEEAFRYHEWDDQQRIAGTAVRTALEQAAKIIVENVPASPSRHRALTNILDARMLANQAITFRGAL